MSSMGAVARSPRLGRSPEDPDDRLRRVAIPRRSPPALRITSTHDATTSASRAHHHHRQRSHGIGCGTGKARRSDARSMPVCRGTNQIPLAAIAEAEAKRQPDKKVGERCAQ